MAIKSRSSAVTAAPSSIKKSNAGSSKLVIETAEVFEPLLYPARYKGAHGGRGSGKSHFFAELMVEEHLRFKGHRSVCIREVQRTLAQSSKLVLEDKINALGLSSRFNILNDRIQTPGDGLILFQGMQDHNADSIKSLEGFNRAWVEEAQSLSKRSLTLLRPTIRANDSELWFSWNARRRTDAVDQFLRQDKPDNAIIVHANWRDNPWFTKELEAERQLDLDKYPDQYEHVWEGDYVTIFEGAYYAKQLKEAQASGRITNVARDEIIQTRAFWDIGGPTKRSDAMTIWVAQFVDREIRVLHYIEGQGQGLGYFVNELREAGYDKCLCVLPHDGVTIHADNPTQKSLEDQLRQAGFKTDIVKNQGPGAAMQRVTVARRLFPRVWFNKGTTEGGRDALGAYHPKKSDDSRELDMGPEHDWASHAADAFGLMCVAYEEPRKQIERVLVPRLGTMA